jgi:type IV secretory pathway VirB10-like protein
VSDDSDSQEATSDDQPPVEGDVDQQQQSDNQPSADFQPDPRAATGDQPPPVGVPGPVNVAARRAPDRLRQRHAHLRGRALSPATFPAGV